MGFRTCGRPHPKRKCRTANLWLFFPGASPYNVPMRIVGITAEYNPFHNGHLYHLQEAKRRADADGAAVVMSGNYVQRGLPACVDKYRRTRMALEGGADIVIELPAAAALSSAEGFAQNAVEILTGLGVSDIAYGCEDTSENRTPLPSADTAPSARGPADPYSNVLAELAQVLLEEPPAYRTALQTALKSGKNFPAARQEAARRILESPGACEKYGLEPKSADLLATPNNILGIEYEKARLRLKADIRTHAVPRSDSGYHATGTVLRAAMEAADTAALSQNLPAVSLRLLDYHVVPDDYSDLLAYRLTGETAVHLAETFPWLDPDLAARIVRLSGPALSFDAFAEALTTRNTTRTAVCRALFRILLGLQHPAAPLPFFHVLGFRRDSRILNTVKKRADRPLITKAADIPAPYFDDELRADRIYALAVYRKTSIRLPDAFHAGPVIL